jgi:uncharacterized protein (TIGR02246 family)
MRNAPRVLIATAIAGLVVAGVFAGKNLVTAGREPEAVATGGGGDGRDADRQALRKLTENLLKAVETGDAKGLANLFTEQGEYTAGGTALHGRAAIAKAYEAFFKAHPKIKVLRSEVEPVRFLAKDTAVQEGTVKVHKGGAAEPTTNRFSILYVREGGNWHIAMLHEGASAAATLDDLDLLVGNWTATKDGVEMNVKYEWTLNKAFLKGHFTVKDAGKTTEGVQFIGHDPATGQIRSWSFDSDGGFGHAYWTREGKVWSVEASGIQGDGSILTAVNIISGIDANAFTWQSTQRTIDGESVGDLPPVAVTRVKTGK